MPHGLDYDTHAPIVRLWWRGDTERDAVASCLEAFTAMLESSERAVLLVVDFSELGTADAAARKQLASWRATHQRLIQAKVRAVAYVLTSRIVRGYLTAVDWLRPNRGIVRGSFATVDEAVVWLRER